MNPSLRVILVRPRNPGNIGASARALANFGLHELTVVDPYEPIWKEAKAAPDAEDVLEKARITSTLAEALEGCTCILGTSSFHQRKPEQFVMSLPNIKEWVTTHHPTGKIAIVFGSERSGLSNEELSACHAVIHIPTQPDCPSMNLAQAVAVVLYEWTKTRPLSRSSPNFNKVVSTDIVQEWMRVADQLGYPAGYTQAKRAGRVRAALSGLSAAPETSRFLISFLRWVRRKTERS